MTADQYQYINVGTGSAVGNKRIALFDQAYTVVMVKLTISSAADTPVILNFAAHLCDSY